MADVAKGRFTFRFAAVCFGLSAIWEMLSVQGDALLLGHVVRGSGAAVYHLVYLVLFAWIAAGLWRGTRSGYYVLIATSVIYTADRLQMLLVGNAVETLIREQFAGNEQLLQLVSVQEMWQMLTLMTVVFLLGWWGFVGYAYYRRDYFGIRPNRM